MKKQKRIMAENRTMDGIHRNLLKKFHTLCTVLGITAEEKAMMLGAYDVESSRDLDTHALVDLCGKLSAQASDRQFKTLNTLRKRCMGAIGGWLERTGQYSNASIIKAIACRATRYDDFNKIPKERLRNLIGLFNNKQKDMEAAEALKRENTKTIIFKPQNDDKD